ncbi:hypothetical protein LOTGIDRAFT_237828 [Lottia gigantea]|uniref:Peptidase M3A/M3B catalytic domain-containing protein n=1 Tax=Lottia gigantea TaxID=225164 RepID=V4AGD9_LOTGI|nr:hypothetical protein LOTGIDRAFT_237828 [Lottia gigantea]ESP03109.1 hypothetical protein LOTGIDRAFT_237828 [Lottia gigantea]
MAASMVFRNTRQYLRNIQCISRTSVRGAKDFKLAEAGVFHVFLPMLPPDTEETNTFMDYKNYPNMSEITPAKMLTGTVKRSILYHTEVGNLMFELKDSKKKKTFNEIFGCIENISIPLNFAETLTELCCFLSRDGEFMSVKERLRPQTVMSRVERFRSEAFYDTIREMKVNQELDEYQTTLVNYYLHNMVINGVHLGTEKKKYSNAVDYYENLCQTYRHLVYRCDEIYVKVIYDFRILQDVPLDVLRATAVDGRTPHRGPWRLTFHKDIYHAIMKYCSDRPTRCILYGDYMQRCGIGYHGTNICTRDVLENLLNQTDINATILGYNSYAELSLDSKMAGSVDNVKALFRLYNKELYPEVIEELEELQEFAKSCGFPHKLEMWDVEYFRNLQANHLYPIDENVVSDYFALSSVEEKFFGLCESLFGITIKEVECDENHIWLPTVKLYKIYNTDGEELASFFYDPHEYPTKIQRSEVMFGRDQSEILDVKPFATISLSLSQSTIPDTPTTMTFDQVTEFFFLFGKAFQKLLAKVPYAELADLQVMEVDARDICGNFFKKFCYEPFFLQQITSHIDTKQPMPMELVESLIKNKRHFEKWDIVRLLYYSEVDIELYTTDDEWNVIMARAWKKWNPFPFNNGYTEIFALSDIVCNDHKAAYYSHVWSKMVAADLFRAFQEAELENQTKMVELGKRFKDTYLTLGCGVPASEVFRRFRGRDPSFKILLEEMDIEDDKLLSSG